MMEELDADEKKLYSTDLKRYAERDIVQFVPFNKFKVELRYNETRIS
jgi:hypothetical protein